MHTIDSFKGQYAFLSNFHPSPLTIGPLTMPTLENAYQSLKCLFPTDRKQFVDLTPGQAKRLGRTVALRMDWEHVKVDAMRVLLIRKFASPDLKAGLLATGDWKLIEGNAWGDEFWGVCKGKGKNMLGRLLMGVRDYFRIEP